MAYYLEMRERAEVMGPSIFCYGDHEFTHQWLGVDALRSSTPCSSANSSAMSKKQASTKRWSGYCWQWNENKTSRQVPCKFRGDVKIPSRWLQPNGCSIHKGSIAFTK